MKPRTEYDSHEAVSLATGLECKDPSKTQQEHCDECDINVIVKRFGVVPLASPVVRTPMYGDFTGVKDYHSALQAVMEADEAFMALPPDLRSAFQNNPQLAMESIARGELDAFAQHGIKELEPVFGGEATNVPPPKPATKDDATAAPPANP